MIHTTPSGFRDVLADEAIERERIARCVQDLLADAGYIPIETPTLERMAVMQAGERIPASSFKFFDATGDCLTMRPDVTLQVARMCAMRFANVHEPLRFRYMQRIFRDIGAQMCAEGREQKQIGVECIGAHGSKIDAEVIGLFVQALEIAGVHEFRLSLATVGVLRALLVASCASDTWKAKLLDAFHRSNFVDIDRLVDCAEAKDLKLALAIRELSRIRGGAEAIKRARECVAPFGCAEVLDSFEQTFQLLAQAGMADRILIDFSVMSSFDYYTGIVFEAFAPGVGVPIGSGGRYDKLLASYGSDRPAAGFAFYIEQAMAAAAMQVEAERPLRIAIPKGSLNADSIAALAEAGLTVAGLGNPGRSLIIRNPGVHYIIVRPSDAAVFVETGAADCGICGEDSLQESAADVVELADLRFGACRFVVAELEGAAEVIANHYRTLGSVRVATKYPRIAHRYFARCGIQAEIVPLHGNIELDPLTGMSEYIVDITATGTTLRENNLVVTDEVLDSTARFFANTASFRTDARVRDLAEKLSRFSSDKELKVTAGGEGK